VLEFVAAGPVEPSSTVLVRWNRSGDADAGCLRGFVVMEREVECSGL